MAETLADALPKVMAEVRDVVLPAYEDVLPYAPMTGLTIAVIKASLTLPSKSYSCPEEVGDPSATCANGKMVTLPMALHDKETCDSL
jgi:hypothetical protein